MAASGFQRLRASDLARCRPSAVLRQSAAPPEFNEASIGGHFKGADPTVDVELLERAWVDGTETLNIGKADKLQRRLKEYREFGRGRPVGHRGGRYIWQLADAQDLLVCWSVTLDSPRVVESALIGDFKVVFGRRPFANLQD